MSPALGDPLVPGNPGTLSLVPLVATGLPRIVHGAGTDEDLGSTRGFIIVELLTGLCWTEP